MSAEQPRSESPRIDWETYLAAVPEVYPALSAIGQALKASGLDTALQELIKIRASQLNGCAFCLQFHLNDARKLGVSSAKLDLLPAWRDAGIFSAKEQAALRWTEHITLAAQHHTSDEDFAKVSAHFSPKEIAQLTTAIAQINFWNRIAAPFRFTPPIPKA